MKKVTLLISMVCFLTATAFCQRAQEETVTVDKTNLPGFTLTFTDIDQKIISDAMQDRLSNKAGLKSSRSSGYTAYINQPFPEFGNAHYDIYYKVEKAGNRNSKISVLYFVVTKGNLNPITTSADGQVVENIKNFLNNFVDYAKAYDTQNNLSNMNKELEKQQKNHDKLVSKQEKLQKQAEDMQKEIEQSRVDMEKTRSDMNKNNILLEQYRR